MPHFTVIVDSYVMVKKCLLEIERADDLNLQEDGVQCFYFNTQRSGFLEVGTAFLQCRAYRGQKPPPPQKKKTGLDFLPKHALPLPFRTLEGIKQSPLAMCAILPAYPRHDDLKP